MNLTEENGFYTINCDNLLWATDEQHSIYQNSTECLLNDADWFIETENTIMIIEYKNGNVYNSNNKFNPLKDNYIDKVARKYYDSLHYLTLLKKNKPKKYIYIVEYPKSDSVSRKMLREKILKKLPFDLQKKLSSDIKLIDSFDVLSIDEWNEKYPDYPISRTEKQFKEDT